jgi:hypothetical protein
MAHFALLAVLVAVSLPAVQSDAEHLESLAHKGDIKYIECSVCMKGMRELKAQAR